MSIEPKWRRLEYSVATDDDRHIYSTKTMMKDREECERTEREDYRAVKKMGRGVAG